METRHTIIHHHELIVATAQGQLDLAASKAALAELTSAPDYNDQYELLLDLRGAKCDFTSADLYELATAIAWPEPLLPARNKVAILVDQGTAFDHAEFLALCAGNRGMRIMAFWSADDARNWLNADVCEDATNNT